MNHHLDQPSRKLVGLALIAYKKNLKLTNEQKDILIGTLLGDASIACKKGKPVCVKFEQKATREKYIYHLFTIFQSYVGTPPRLRTFENDFHLKPGQSVWFRTYAHESLLFYENLFYTVNQDKKRVKRVPKNIHKLLTPRALAYWFMDDGSKHVKYKITSKISSYVINTHGFTYDDQKILVCAFKRLYNINVDIHKDRHYYRLSIGASSRDRFKNLIYPYIHDDFLYKVSATQKRIPSPLEPLGEQK